MKRRRAGTYWILADPGLRDHPMVVTLRDGSSLGWVYEHAYVLYEKLGPGPHPCHYCKKMLEWKDGGKGIQVDHMDDDTDNNSPENLVAACIVCNTDRGRSMTRSEQAKLLNDKEYACKRCDKVLSSLGALRGHSAWCGEERREKMQKMTVDREQRKRDRSS